MPQSVSGIRSALPHEAALRQNLSPRLVRHLADLYSESVHVSEVGLDQADDREVWEYARAEGFILVSKDADFSELGVLLGHPPKVIWIQRGNCSTREVELLLRSAPPGVRKLDMDEEVGVLLVG